ncbi:MULTISPECIES: hypothetical protein [unclassified Roseivirga]|jgi:hypothetical protein|uniref:hypothetical protein n=1 Tax=unclassified Roseivirga TaxID=2626142 RepID=UPI00257E712A|nr:MULTISPECIES: hypothetical protein [unclassified Roseivirga]MEC7756163.1 hypothetical protein [Bacteroidota bacterium]|tara:strand:+ start:7975 stop:8562 length:588 start_codon:yes stop_codon:yes gene_type:complete
MTGHHVNYIKAYLKSKGFTDLELMDDLTDHLATEIEFSMDSEKLDFETSFERAKQKLLPDSPYQLERDLKILTTPKHNIMIKKIAYIGGYLSAMCLMLALLLGSLTYHEKINSNLSRELAQSQNELSMILEDEVDRTANYISYMKEMEMSQIAVIQNLAAVQALIVAAIALFSITYLPYRFYNSYQRSQLELNSL